VNSLLPSAYLQADAFTDFKRKALFSRSLGFSSTKGPASLNGARCNKSVELMVNRTSPGDQALLTPNRHLKVGVGNPWSMTGHGFDGERNAADLLVRMGNEMCCGVPAFVAARQRRRFGAGSAQKES
jgi:hypothetical protein